MTLLLLGGTGEAREIANALVGRDVIVSLAGATRTPKVPDLPLRIGGFGGEMGFRRFLADKAVSAVLDATHPFAHRITSRTARVCAERAIPYLHYLRPPWTPVAGDNWTIIETEAAAADHIPQDATVFLGTGRQTLAAFANLAPRPVICRQIDPPEGPFPFPGGRFLVGRPPFAVADEIALFRSLGVDVLVVKNAGGAASATKLTAARTLGLPVLMLARPACGNWPVVDQVADALAWVEGL